MSKLNKEKTLEKLQLLDANIYLDKSGFVRDYLDDAIFNIEDSYFADCVENDQTEAWDSNKGFVIRYLHRFRNEIIVREYTEKEIRDVIENKLHLEIDDAGYIKCDDDKRECYMCLQKIDAFVKFFNEERCFSSPASDLLATIVRKELENGK